MKIRIFLVAVSMMLFMGCSEKSIPELPADKDFDFISVDGKYVLRYHPIGEAEFREKFQVGWRCSEICDVYPDATIGDLNLVRTLIPGPPVSKFSIVSSNSIKAYTSFHDGEISESFYFMTTYRYGENNKLELYDLGGDFDGGTLISITDEEMVVIGRKWNHDYSDPSSIKNIYKFQKLTKESVEKMDAESKPLN